MLQFALLGEASAMKRFEYLTIVVIVVLFLTLGPITPGREQANTVPFLPGDQWIEGIEGFSFRGSPHEWPWAKPMVESVAFSPDGNRIAAAFYKPPMNRPRTDWSVRTAQWDLAKRERVIVPNACGPVAFSPDGQTIAMAVYERSRENGLRTFPQTRLALWKTGQSKPIRLLQRGPEKDSSVVAAAFSPDGRQVASLTRSGEVLLWDVHGEQDPVLVEKLALFGIRGSIQTVVYPGWGATLAFSADGRMLATTGAWLTKAWRDRPGIRAPGAVVWRLEHETKMFKRMGIYGGGLLAYDAHFVDLLDRADQDRWAWRIKLPSASNPNEEEILAKQMNKEFAHLYRQRLYVRPVPGDQAVAFSWGPFYPIGKTEIRACDGELLKSLKHGGGPVAFTPDGRFLAVAGDAGYIYIWKVDGWELAYTLDLAGQPPSHGIVSHTAVQPPGNKSEIAEKIQTQTAKPVEANNEFPMAPGSKAPEASK